MSGTFDLGQTSVEVSAAVGAVVLPWIGDEADALLYDPVTIEGVRVSPAAAGVEVTLPHGIGAEARIEQGVVHGAEVELAEARIGWTAPAGTVGLGLGRSHLPLTWERSFETEDLALSYRPVRSRAPLPLHANGVDLVLAWPERLTLRGGAFWATATADAPHLWARLDVTPLGGPPERQDGDAEAPVAGIGAGLARRDSPLLGLETVVAVDAIVAWRSYALEAGALRFVEEGSDDAWVGVRGRVVKLPGGSDLYAAGRGERIAGLVEGEDERWAALGRFSWRTPDAWAAVFVEAHASREIGPGSAGPGDVVDLGRAERANDGFGVGAWARW